MSDVDREAEEDKVDRDFARRLLAHRTIGFGSVMARLASAAPPEDQQGADGVRLPDGGPWAVVRELATQKTAGVLPEATPGQIAMNMEYKDHLSSEHTTEERENELLPQLVGFDSGTGVVGVDGTNGSCEGPASFGRAPIEACRLVHDYISKHWDPVTFRLPLPPPTDKHSRPHMFSGYADYPYHHANLKQKEEMHYHSKKEQLSSTIVFSDVRRARAHIPGFEDLEKWAADVAARASGGERLRSTYPHHLRQHSTHARFGYHIDTHSFSRQTSTAVLTIVLLLNGGPSSMHVAGFDDSFHFTQVGEAALFHSKMWHATMETTVSTEKMTFFFGKLKTDKTNEQGGSSAKDARKGAGPSDDAAATRRQHPSRGHGEGKRPREDGS